MSRKAELARYGAALAGALCFLVISFFPLFGGAAKQEVRCRGRVFSGAFDDCFHDYLPLVELLAPLVALGLIWPFLRLSFTLWAPEEGSRSLGWRWAGRAAKRDYSLRLECLTLLAMAWIFWRAALYPIDRVTLPFQAVWLLFAFLWGCSFFVWRRDGGRSES